MTALTWGWGIEDTAARLMEESDKAREDGVSRKQKLAHASK
jgi:hypothetical protein